MNVQEMLPILQLLLAGGNLSIMLFALAKFVKKPYDTLEQRILSLEVDVKEIKDSLKLGNDEYRDQKERNEVMQTCMLALIDFELSYCSHTNYDEDGIEDLQEAKRILRSHLGKK